MEPPQTLHAQLYLLAYDCERQTFRFDRRQLFGFALRAAMLTDLYLAGHLIDRGGKAWATAAREPADPVLRAVLSSAAGRDWHQLISRRNNRVVLSILVAGELDQLASRGNKQAYAFQAVRDQLEATGCIRKKQRRMLGVIPTAHFEVYDESMVKALADQVTGSLRHAIDYRKAGPRPLAVGLIAVQAQMPVVSSFIDDERQRERLRQIACVAIEPIQAGCVPHSGVSRAGDSPEALRVSTMP